MKNKYFEYIAIEKGIVIDFLARHTELKKFVNADTPFYARIYKKPYVGLIHTIISQDETSEKIEIMWNQLNDFLKKVKERKVAKLSDEILFRIAGESKGKLIRYITNDIMSGTLKLKSLKKQSQQNLLDALGRYEGLSLNSIKLFALFSFFRKDVLCDTDPDFIKGLQVFLNKQNITQEDIDHIKIEYKGEETLFSLCMWKIRNERTGQ